MIKLTSFRLLLSFCILSSGLLLSSCEKDENKNDGKVVLLSFGPTGAKHGDTLRFIGLNLDKVTAIQFTGQGAAATIDKKDFALQTAELIKLIVPTVAEKGYVTVKTSAGDIVSKTMFNLKVASTISSIVPPQAKPGTNITITGNFLNWVKSVTFARDKVVTSFVSKSLNQLIVKVPDDAQTGPIIIAYQGTDSSFVESTDTLKVTLPVSTSFSPNPVKHAENVTITGTDLDLVKKVFFNGVSAAVTSFVSQSATQLVVQIPASTTKGKVKLEAASGVQTTSGSDLDVVLPAITNMAPNPVDPDTDLTITGTNLDVVSSVAFIGVPTAVSSFVSQSPTQLVVKVPASGAVTGRLTLYVRNSTLSVQSAGDLAIVGSSVPPIIIYDDALTSAWNGWTGGGWGGAKDVNNTSPVRSGTKSVKIDYTDGGWGVPWQLGGANISLGGYTSLKFSVYGGTGSDGKTVNVGFNEADGKSFTVVEGQWTDFEIPLSQISSASTLRYLYFKNYTPSGAYTIYLDNIGIY